MRAETYAVDRCNSHILLSTLQSSITLQLQTTSCRSQHRLLSFKWRYIDADSDDDDTVMMFTMMVTTKIMTTMVDNDDDAYDDDNDNDSLLWQRSM